MSQVEIKIPENFQKKKRGKTVFLRLGKNGKLEICLIIKTSEKHNFLRSDIVSREFSFRINNNHMCLNLKSKIILT